MFYIELIHWWVRGSLCEPNTLCSWNWIRIKVEGWVPVKPVLSPIGPQFYWNYYAFQRYKMVCPMQNCLFSLYTSQVPGYIERTRYDASICLVSTIWPTIHWGSTVSGCEKQVVWFKGLLFSHTRFFVPSLHFSVPDKQPSDLQVNNFSLETPKKGN